MYSLKEYFKEILFLIPPQGKVQKVTLQAVLYFVVKLRKMCNISSS